jgi:hypothetical protein
VSLAILLFKFPDLGDEADVGNGFIGSQPCEYSVDEQETRKDGSDRAEQHDGKKS